MAGRGARKPEHQWRVHAGVAVRRAPQSDAADPDKTEAFDIIDEQGVSVGAVTLGLTAQRIEHGLADASDLPDAVRCWLAARGARSIDLRDATGSSVARGPFDVRQLSGRAPTGPVRRIVSLAPSNADVITALECFDRVVACESSSEPPSEFSEVERLGPDLGPNLDRIAALEPDLVLSSLSVPGMERVVTQLRTRGIAQLVLAPRSLSEVMDDVRAVAQVLEVAARGERVVDAMRQEIAALRAQAQQRPTPARVYLEWWPRPMFTPGADCFSGELIALAGGTNVFGQRPGASLQIEAQDLVAAAPDICFVSWCGVTEDKLDPEKLTTRPGLEALPAAVAGHVYPLDERFSGRPGPRMLEAARRMAAAIGRLPT